MNKVYADPKLALKKDMPFYTPTDNSLVKNPCGSGEQYMLNDGSMGTGVDFNEDMNEPEYKP